MPRTGILAQSAANVTSPGRSRGVQRAWPLHPTQLYWVRRLKGSHTPIEVLSDVLPRVQTSRGWALRRFIACCHHVNCDCLAIRRFHAAALLSFSWSNHLRLSSDTSTCAQQGSPRSRRFQVPEPLPSCSVTVVVEGPLLGG